MKQQELSGISEDLNLQLANEEFWTNRLIRHHQLPDPYQGMEVMIDDIGKIELDHTFSIEEGTRLKKLCGEDDINIYCFLLSGLSLILSDYVGKTSFLLPTPAFKEAEGLSPLFLKIEEPGSQDRTFKEFLLENREKVVQAIRHQAYQYDNVRAKLNAGDETVPEAAIFSFSFAEIQYAKTGIPEIVSFAAGFDEKQRLKIKVRKAENFSLVSSRSLLEGFVEILKTLVTEPKQTIEELLVHLFEVRKVRKPAVTASPSESLVDMWNSRVEDNRPHPAMALRDQNISFGQLEQNIDKLALYLRDQLEIGKGDIVALFLSNPEEMVTGIWATLKTGAAYVPIDPDLPQNRRKFMLEDTQPALVISNAESLLELEGFEGKIFGIDVQLDSLPDGKVSFLPDPEDLAYIIYTSGSSGKPKGVKVSHASLVNLIKDQISRMQVSRADRILNMLPYSFDVAHYHMFMSLLSGACLVDTGSELIREPEKFYEYLEKKGVTIAGIPPAYLATLDPEKLLFLRIVYTGGESPGRANIDYLINHQVRVFNQYGLTETTCTSLMYEFDTEKHTGLIPIGSPVSDTRVYLLDENLLPVPLGEKGEMYIAGRGLARGYLNRPEMDQQRFMENPLEKGERLFRTGDLGQRLVSGDIVFLGRADRQVKIRGHRIELGEIENVLDQYQGVQSIAVDTLENKHGQKELVAYFVAADHSESKTLQGFAQEFLPFYMVPSIFIRLESIPITPHGKVDYKALASLTPQQQEEDLAVPPGNELEKSLLEIWKEILDKSTIGISDNFFEIGGHSLNATQVVSTIYQKLGINVELGLIFSHPTIVELAKVLQNEAKEIPDEIVPLQGKDYYEVSHAQKRLWILDQLHKTTAYNIPGAFILDQLDVAAFKKALTTLAERQESLRTRFISVDGEPIQQIMESVSLKELMIERDISMLEDRYETAKSLVEEESARTFDLENGPLFRATLLKVEDERYIFVFCMHHIISDGWSLTVMVDEITTLYRAYKTGLPNPLKALRIQYKDFAVWQNKRVRESADEQFWLNKLSGGASLVQFSYDYPKGELTSFNGSSESVMIHPEKVEQLITLSHNNHCTLSVVVFSIYNVLLHQLTGQKEICVAMTVANRTNSDIEKIIGYFANLIIVKTDFSQDVSFEELIAQVRNDLVEAINHQNYPFDLLVERLNPDRDNDFQPLFNVGYTFQSQQDVKISLDLEEDHAPSGDEDSALKAANFSTGSKGTTSKFEMLLFVEKGPAGMNLVMEYNTDLFAPDTIRQYLTFFERIIDSLTQLN